MRYTYKTISFRKDSTTVKFLKSANRRSAANLAHLAKLKRGDVESVVVVEFEESGVITDIYVTT